MTLEAATPSSPHPQKCAYSSPSRYTTSNIMMSNSICQTSVSPTNSSTCSPNLCFFLKRFMWILLHICVCVCVRGLCVCIVNYQILEHQICSKVKSLESFDSPKYPKMRAMKGLYTSIWPNATKQSSLI